MARQVKKTSKKAPRKKAAPKSKGLGDSIEKLIGDCLRAFGKL